MKKDIIFYSNYCTYSKEILNQISKTSINDNIAYVCVDDPNIQLPNFITAVPTIYLVDEKKIVVDEAITGWIKEKTTKPQTDELQAYFGSTSGSYGNQFSLIDNSDEKPFISPYTFIGDEQKITTPDADAVGNSKGSAQNGLSNQMEQMQQQRSMDFQQINRR